MIKLLIRLLVLGALFAGFSVSASAGANRAFGDSVTRGVGCSTPDKCYIPLLETALGVSFTNHGLDGGTFLNMAAPVYAASPSAGDLNTIFLGVNDERLWNGNAAAKDQYARGVSALAAYLTTPAKLTGASCTATGSWAASPYFAIGKRTASNGASLTCSGAFGTSVYIGYAAINGDTGTFDVYVDGVKVATGSSAGAGVVDYYGSIGYAPQLLRIGGLTNTNHTVRIDFTGAAGSVEVDWVAGNVQPDRAAAYVLNIPLANNYFGGSAANVAAYNTALDDVLTNLIADGLPITKVDIYSLLAPATDIIGGDLHPNDSGMAKIEAVLFSAITSASQLPSGITFTPSLTWGGSDGRFYVGPDTSHLSVMVTRPVAAAPSPPPPPPPGGGCADVSAMSGSVKVGNMTGNGGLTSIFSNATAAPFGSSGGGPINGAGWVGLQFPTPIVPCKAVVWCADGSGSIRCSTGSNSDMITFKQWGKNGTCDGIGGDLLATHPPFANGGAPVKHELIPTTSTAYTCHWVTQESSAYGGGYEVMSSLRLWGLQ